MADKPSVDVGSHTVCLEGDLQSFAGSLSAERLAEDLYSVTLTLRATEAAAPPELALVFSQPVIDIQTA